MGRAVLLLHRDRAARIASVQGVASDRRLQLLHVLHSLRSGKADRQVQASIRTGDTRLRRRTTRHRTSLPTCTCRTAIACSAETSPAYRVPRSRTAPCRKAWGRSSIEPRSTSAPATRRSSSIADCCSKKLKEMDEGKPLPALDPSLSYISARAHSQYRRTSPGRTSSMAGRIRE